MRGRASMMQMTSKPKPCIQPYSTWLPPAALIDNVVACYSLHSLINIPAGVAGGVEAKSDLFGALPRHYPKFQLCRQSYI
jgi:hypothetical protein